MRTRQVLSACVSLLVLAGCGKVHGIAVEETATALAQAICPKAYSCCSAQQLMGNAATGKTESECEVNTAQNFQQQLAVVEASDNDGRAKYEPAKVDACLAAIRAASCGDLTMIHSLAQIPGCDSTFVTPLVSAGGKCQQDYECIAGVCQRPSGSFDGVCVSGVSAGASCASDRCSPALTCDGVGTMDASDDVCVAAQEDGASCTDSVGCKSRNCVAGTNGAKTCQAPASPQCFYGGGCRVAPGRLRATDLLVMVLLGAAALRRRARQAAVTARS